MPAGSDENDRARTLVPAVGESDRQAKIRKAQELVARYVPSEVSLVDELLAERRKEATRE